MVMVIFPAVKEQLRLKAVRAAMAGYRDRLAALMMTPDGVEEEATVPVMSLLEWLDGAESEEAALSVAVDGFANLVEQLVGRRQGETGGGEGEA
ncbi:Os12g0504800 [Oryza sativa Japonica Group]|uniref:Os12g0504800 protein n=4 Tax=Oryza TaxID=4527 RepID=A0A0P0YAB7_ORYSJ|nr:Os12g0504800 [Oryza sativa Japonica Group]